MARTGSWKLWLAESWLCPIGPRQHVVASPDARVVRLRARDEHFDGYVWVARLVQPRPPKCCPHALFVEALVDEMRLHLIATDTWSTRSGVGWEPLDVPTVDADDQWSRQGHGQKSIDAL